MNDLVQSQIQESCKLALPNGLKELMWDISREVLRAQPADLCTFISEYLLALLVTRENSAVAHSICGDVCNEVCQVPLDEELRNIGFTDEDAATAARVAKNMFASEEVKEGAILTKIIRLESMSEDKLEAVKDAICKAYLLHKHPDLCKSPSDISDLDVVDRAVRHTLRLYKCSKPSDEEYNRAATNIQAAYRAYGVRRHLGHSRSITSSQGTDVEQDKILFYQQDDLFSDSDGHGKVYTVMSDEYIKSIRFHHEDPCDPNAKDVCKPVVKAVEPKDSKVLKKACLHTASSISLAGSFVHLPKFTPYTAISENSEPDETSDGGHEDKSKHQEKRDPKLSEREINISDYNEFEVHIYNKDCQQYNETNTAVKTAAEKGVIEVFTKRYSKDNDKGSHNTVRDNIVEDQARDNASYSEENVLNKRAISHKGSIVKDIFKKGCLKDTSSRGRVDEKSVRESIVQSTSVRSSIVNDISVKNSFVKDVSIRDSITKGTSLRSSILKDTSARGSVVEDIFTKDNDVNDIINGIIAKRNSLTSSAIEEQEADDNVFKDSFVKSTVTNNSVTGSVVKVDFTSGSVENYKCVRESIVAEASAVKDNGGRGSVVNSNTVRTSVVNENYVRGINVNNNSRKGSTGYSVRSSVVKDIVVTENNIVKDIIYNPISHVPDDFEKSDLEESFERNMFVYNIVEENEENDI